MILFDSRLSTGCSQLSRQNLASLSSQRLDANPDGDERASLPPTTLLLPGD